MGVPLGSRSLIHLGILKARSSVVCCQDTSSDLDKGFSHGHEAACPLVHQFEILSELVQIQGSLCRSKKTSSPMKEQTFDIGPLAADRS